MGARAIAALAAAALFGCAPKASRPDTASAPRLFVAAGAQGGDGSAERPFGHIAEALAAAGEGGTIELAHGRYPEALRVVRAVEVEGPRDAVVVAPDGAVAIAVDAPARLAGFTVEGGARGVAARAPLRLERLALRGQRTAAVACTDGCAATLTEVLLSGAGDGAGLLVGAGAKLEARRSALSGYSLCATANARATLVLDSCSTQRCEYNAVAAVEARLELRRHLHSGPARGAAVQLVGADALIEGGVITDPGPTGIAVRLGRTLIRGTSVSGARVDADGDLGDGVLAVEPASLELVLARLDANGGAGLAVMGGRAVARELSARGNGRAAVLAERGAHVALEGGELDGANRPGLVAIEGGTIEARGVILRRASVEQDTASGAAVRLLGPGR